MQIQIITNVLLIIASLLTIGFITQNQIQTQNLSSSSNENMIEYISTDRAPQSTHDSQATLLTQSGQIYISGQLGVDPKTGEFVSGGIKEQMQMAFLNVRNILEAAGSSLDNIFKVTVYITNASDVDEMNKEFVKYFSTNAQPARSLVQALIPADGALVELDVMAIQ